MKESNKYKEQLISEIEKQLLKKRIFTSIRRLKIKKQVYRWGIAASVAVLIGTGFYLQNKVATDNSTQKLAILSNAENILPTDKTTLILEKGKDLIIDGDSSSIAYSNTGEEVSIANQRTVVQEKTKTTNKEKLNTLVVPYGKRTELLLSDGSKVWLNSGSKLIYPVQFNDAKREVYLIGEAVFDVSHDANRPFKVLSKNQEIEVLGTVFNVSSYPDDNINFVVLKEGSVKVSHENTDKGFFAPKKKSMIIKPGTMSKIHVQTGKVIAKEVNVQQYFAWKEGLLILKKNRLHYIIKKLARYYNIKIELEDKLIGQETFSGALNLSDSLEEVLDILNKSINTHYKVTDTNTIKLMFNPKK
ncbi:ferric-dicitrate binding protein FerR (iron transport regulator) [Wenyingzhuangia heitensis]|uniref:Ferric-dicitrate binding protein FerR (Iron transport regulator) n=1 Tax=Wenyingzhuangia heitensis TaxID=1487859 RepID=A0ABX0UA00_9FLAO|nr:FecR domain-containing protein [Wenyingzhuangia heitensis]NIJ43907.1 ferric-dicitrate binding protein FerR (iron transport regulator) [Wenyingzhuangia heitensis]